MWHICFIYYSFFNILINRVCLCNKSTSQCEIWQYFVSFSHFWFLIEFFISIFIANVRNISKGFFLQLGIFGDFNHFHWKFGGFWFKFIEQRVIIWIINGIFYLLVKQNLVRSYTVLGTFTGKFLLI